MQIRAKTSIELHKIHSAMLDWLLPLLEGAKLWLLVIVSVFCLSMKYFFQFWLRGLRGHTTAPSPPGGTWRPGSRCRRAGRAGGAGSFSYHAVQWCNRRNSQYQIYLFLFRDDLGQFTLIWLILGCIQLLHKPKENRCF